MEQPPHPAVVDRISPRIDDGAWRLLRLALCVWASIVLVRHASYWGGVAIDGGLFSAVTGDPRPLLFAAVEVATLVTLLLTLLPATTPTRLNLSRVARLAAIFIIANVLSFSLDLFTTSRNFENYGLHFVWMVASRAQLLVVPALAIVAWARSRSASTSRTPMS